MMSPSKRFFLFVFLLGCLMSCDTSNSIDPPFSNYFIKYYGGDGDQSAVDLIANPDGTFTLLGNWQSGADNRIYLVKVDAIGEVIWEKKVGTTRDKAKDIEFTNDGNYVILSEFENTLTDIQFKLIRITSEGIKIDSVVDGSPGNDIAKTVTPLLDGGFIVTGATEYDTTLRLDPSQPDDRSDIFHFRCNSNLKFEKIFWKSQYGTGTFDAGTKVIQFSSDRFYVFGYTNQNHEGNSTENLNLIYYSLDAGGLNSNPNYLGDFDNETESSFVMKVPGSLGGGFLITGTTSHADTVTLHVSKLRTPLTFNSENDEQFGKELKIKNAPKLTSVSATSSVFDNQGYLLLANEARESGGNIWITKIDQSGNLLWSSSFGSSEGNDLGSALLETNDGRILVVGTVRLINNQSKMVLMKLNSKGQLKQ